MYETFTIGHVKCILVFEDTVYLDWFVHFLFDKHLCVLLLDIVIISMPAMFLYGNGLR